MRLTKVEREKINDGALSIQSAQDALREFDESKIPEIDEIHGCLKSADKSLRRALRHVAAERPQP